MFIPGLIVDAIEIDFIYVPFAVLGFIFTKVEINSSAFSLICSGLKETLPIDECTMPNLSTLKAIFPFLTSSTALATSGVTVPDLGLGIKLRGPNTRPSLAIIAITSGVAMITSMSVHPCSIFVMYSSSPT